MVVRVVIGIKRRSSGFEFFGVFAVFFCVWMFLMEYRTYLLSFFSARSCISEVFLNRVFSSCGWYFCGLKWIFLSFIVNRNGELSEGGDRISPVIS